MLQAEGRLPDSQPRSLRTKPDHLWIAVCLPDLALAALHSDPAFDPEPARPSAVYESANGQLRIVAVNEAARLAGVAPGLTVSAALALADSVELCERSESVEDEYLAALAAWASRFTPTVSLEVREGLLLEVRGSLKFFGSLAAIRQALIDELDRRGLRFRIAMAPTPLAALWLARHDGADVSTWHDLAGHLAVLPLAVTAWPERILKRLHEMGITTIGACLRLPREGFARRVGKVCLDDLDKATGRQHDLRPLYDGPKVLGWRTDFANETSDRSVLGRALESGIEIIVADLARNQAQVKQVKLTLGYLRGLSDVMQCDFIEPVHTVPELLDPLVVRLESKRFAGPVATVHVETGPLLSMRAETKTLFDGPGTAAALPGSTAALVECLRGRFGRKGVFGLEIRTDHRPELAFGRLTEDLRCVTANGKSQAPVSDSERPLWILQEPRRLSATTLRTLTRSDLKFRPERIESGWWDGDDVRRDYYVVTTCTGARWWVYRDCVTREWWLHGVFG